MTCQIQWHFAFNESLNKCIKKANANTLSDTSKLVPSKSSIFTGFIKITKNIQKGNRVIGNGGIYFRKEVVVMPNNNKKKSVVLTYLHCKYIQCNFYTFYGCPTFHCNPTVLFTFNCCSKYSGKM